MRVRKSGLIISLSSAAGRFGMPYFGLYCASKWALKLLTTCDDEWRAALKRADPKRRKLLGLF